MSPSLPSRRSFMQMLVTVPVALAALTRRAKAEALAGATDPQPHMKAALASLREAKGHLDAATADKGGHRAKALEHVNAAIKETEEGISYDNRH